MATFIDLTCSSDSTKFTYSVILDSIKCVRMIEQAGKLNYEFLIGNSLYFIDKDSYYKLKELLFK